MPTGAPRTKPHSGIDPGTDGRAEEAACLPTAWLTAYRMVFTKAGPLVDDVRPLADARASFERVAHGELFGKLVLTV